MSQEQELHAPTPWRFEIADRLSGGEDCLLILSAEGEAIAEIQCNPDGEHANAEFIVRACNSHDDLVAGCKDALNVFETSYDGQALYEDWLISDEDRRKIHDLKDRLTAALAKAERRETAPRAQAADASAALEMVAKLRRELPLALAELIHLREQQPKGAEARAAYTLAITQIREALAASGLTIETEGAAL